MSIATTGEKNSLATKYGTDCPYIALTNGAPGTGNIANELASPATPGRRPRGARPAAA
jgi:hypothetical protein